VSGQGRRPGHRGGLVGRLPSRAHSDEEIGVTLRHDNRTPFTSNHYCQVADDLGITLSRTVYRNPDGNAFIERVFRTYKEEPVWLFDFQSFDQAKGKLERWLIDYNEERPHDSLGDRTPTEARAVTLTNYKAAA